MRTPPILPVLLVLGHTVGDVVDRATERQKLLWSLDRVSEWAPPNRKTKHGPPGFQSPKMDSSVYKAPNKRRRPPVTAHRIWLGGDADMRCCYWAGMGECGLGGNPYWMRPYCQKSCGTFGCSVPRTEHCTVRLNTAGCPWQADVTTTAPSLFPRPPLFTLLPSTTLPPLTVFQPRQRKRRLRGEDLHPLCCYWASRDQCFTNPAFMRPRCQHSCGTPGCTQKDAMRCRVKLDVDACTQNVLPLPNHNSSFPEPGQIFGQDVTPHCCYWAAHGECDRNFKWMRTFCQKSCGTYGCVRHLAQFCPVKLDIEGCPWSP